MCKTDAYLAFQYFHPLTPNLSHREFTEHLSLQLITYKSLFHDTARACVTSVQPSQTLGMRHVCAATTDTGHASRLCSHHRHWACVTSVQPSQTLGMRHVCAAITDTGHASRLCSHHRHWACVTSVQPLQTLGMRHVCAAITDTGHASRLCSHYRHSCYANEHPHSQK